MTRIMMRVHRHYRARHLQRAVAIIDKYRDQDIGLADASTVVLADKYDTTKILTLDRRHFEALRPIGGGRFAILP